MFSVERVRTNTFCTDRKFQTEVKMEKVFEKELIKKERVLGYKMTKMVYHP